MLTVLPAPAPSQNLQKKKNLNNKKQKQKPCCFALALTLPWIQSKPRQLCSRWAAHLEGSSDFFNDWLETKWIHGI